MQKNYLKEQKGPGQVQWTTQHWQRANKQQALCEFASIYDHLHMLKLVEIHKEYNIFLSFHDFFSKTPPHFENALQLVLQTVYRNFLDPNTRFKSREYDTYFIKLRHHYFLIGKINFMVM